MLPHLSPGVARVVRVVGQVLIGAGVIVLLFAGYQLWGTGLRHAQAQDRLESEFAERLEAVAAEVPDEPEVVDDVADDEPAEVEVRDLPPEVVDDLLDPADGAAVARIEIPSIGVDEIVVHGVAVSQLRTGPGHYPTSAGFGEPGNAAIAGHRTTYGQPFHDLDQLQPGDEIQVTSLRGTFTYEVEAHPDPDAPAGEDGQPVDERGWFVVGPRDVYVLDDVGDARLTLTACHPKLSSRQRIIVTALLVDDPVEPLPRPDPPPTDEPEAEVPVDFGTGLDGDRGELSGVIVWSVAFLFALAATIAIGRRWRRWPTYLLASPVLIVVLFIAFEHIDRYLPAY